MIGVLNMEDMNAMTLKEKCESMSNNNPDHEFRVDICEHTNEPVLQMLEDDGSWFCMHEES